MGSCLSRACQIVSLAVGSSVFYQLHCSLALIACTAVLCTAALEKYALSLCPIEAAWDAGLRLEAAQAIVRTHAPQLLRALHDRDVRRPFCSPALWLGPHEDACRQGLLGPSAFTHPAVVRALGGPLAAHVRSAALHKTLSSCG